MPSGTIVVDGARLHCSRAGTGPVPLVLLHGLTDDSACWDRVTAALPDNFDVVAPDARGHGRSSGIGDRDFTVARLASDVIGILDALEVRDAVLFGHSMGAITAAAVGAERPDLVRALVLEDPPLDIPIVRAEERRAGMAAEIERWARLDTAARHVEARSEHPEWERTEVDPWAAAKALVDPSVLDHLSLFDAYDWRGIFRRLERPGLLVTGDPERGAIVTPAVAEEALRCWSLGSVLRVPGAGHCIHRDRWAASMQPIAAYLLRQVRLRSD